MTITHYAELVDSKKMVLTRGDILDDKVINAQEVGDVSSLNAGGV